VELAGTPELSPHLEKMAGAEENEKSLHDGAVATPGGDGRCKSRIFAAASRGIHGREVGMENRAPTIF
jgi:hypothetical protein